MYRYCIQYRLMHVNAAIDSSQCLLYLSGMVGTVTRRVQHQGCIQPSQTTHYVGCVQSVTSKHSSCSVELTTT